MTSMLSSFFSRDPRATFAYELPTESIVTQRGISVGSSFKKAEPTEKATCFWSSERERDSLKTQAQKLRTLRHPNVLVYHDQLETENAFYLVTETCLPLIVYMERTKLTAAQKELFVSWGLYQILSGLKFLHNEVKISHNALRDSIFVTAAGDWKLAGFEQSRQFESPRQDLNDLAAIIWQIFNGFKADAPEDPSSARIPKRLQPLFDKLKSKRQVFAVGDILSESRAVGGFMKNKFVDTLLFLEEFQLKESSEKQSFFMHLKDHLNMFPDDVAKYKILPKLIHTYEYGDAGAHILIPMFTLGRLLDEEEYQQRIVPCLVKLFSSPDRSTRVKLLEKIDEFGPHLKPNVVNEKIYGNLATGFLDTNPAVRESTVKAIVGLAEKLNYHNLNTDLMKYLARLQGKLAYQNFTVHSRADDQPGIRTNATICLGKIGCFIDPSHRQRILISAFTRALKDPFPPARMAGIVALTATQQYFSLVEVATKILPALAPLAVDPEKQVRDQGFKAMRGFVEKLEMASENPEKIAEFEAQVKAGGKSGLLDVENMPQWAGWALKTLSGKFYKSSAPPTAAASAEKPPEAIDAVADKSRSGSPALPEKTVEKKPSEDVDGWGELDDDEAEVDAKPTEESKDAAWADDWNEMSGTKAKKPQSTLPSKAPASVGKPLTGVSSARTHKSTGGSLKLNPAVKKPTDDIDFNELVDEKPSNADLFKPAATASSGWEHSGEWGADDNDWGDDGGFASSKPKPAATARDNAAKKAEIAARNEQRRKELEAKRAAKGLGARKVTSKGD